MRALNPWDYCAFGNVLDINTITFCEWAQAKCVMQMYVLTWNWCAFLNNITAPFVWIVNNFLKLDIVVLSLMAQLKLYESWILPQAILTVSLLEVVSPNRLEHEKLFVFLSDQTFNGKALSQVLQDLEQSVELFRRHLHEDKPGW